MVGKQQTERESCPGFREDGDEGFGGRKMPSKQKSCQETI